MHWKIIIYLILWIILQMITYFMLRFMCQRASMLSIKSEGLQNQLPANYESPTVACVGAEQFVVPALAVAAAAVVAAVKAVTSVMGN